MATTTPRCMLAATALAVMLCATFPASPAQEPSEIDTVVDLLELVLDVDTDAGRPILQSLAAKVQTRELAGERLEELRKRLDPLVDRLIADPENSLRNEAVALGASWAHPTAIDAARKLALDDKSSLPLRRAAIDALASARSPTTLEAAAALLDGHVEAELKSATVAALGRLEDVAVANLLLSRYARLGAELQPKAIETLTQRSSWAKALLAEIGAGKIPADVLNVNQVTKLLATSDDELKALVVARWGSVRTERNPQREEVVRSMRRFLHTHYGDPVKGRAVFDRVCGQCHKLYGAGQEVGPEITLNGRASFDQLLANVFDPSLVIGAAYQPRTVAVDDGRVLTGIVTEDSDQRIVLKMQGGKIETIARESVEEVTVSQLSLMPEGLEKQINPTEMADLWALLVLDKPPQDPEAKYIPGAPQGASQRWRGDIERAAPGWTAMAVGEGGVAIVEHRGRSNVLRLHPLDQETPAVLTRRVEIPARGKTTLTVDVSHHEQGDWRLVATVNGEIVESQEITPATTTDGWRRVSLDLSKFAGQTIDVQLLNEPTGWVWEFSFWSSLAIVHTP